MKILIIHQNFPGQFKHLAPELAAAGHDVLALTSRPIEAKAWKGIRIVRYLHNKAVSKEIHAWLTHFEPKAIHGEACYRAALELKAQGCQPDVIVAHPGWGESLFLKDVWPRAKLGIYCEFHYSTATGGIGFDPEFPMDMDEACHVRLMNINNLLHFETADLGISPTQFQANTFPGHFRRRISVVHDGIDTTAVAPRVVPSARLKTASGREITLTPQHPIVTFANRDLEPYRGYHIFMRSLPSLLKRQPEVHVLIMGGGGTSYGKPAPEGQSWRDVFIKEVRPQISDANWDRVHFLGNIPYETFVPLLQLSTVHVYLTYPFVLGWSALEAMSAGCAIVASNTDPVREVLTHHETGRLFDFFDTGALVQEVCDLLQSPSERARLGSQARKFVQQRYDLRTVCLPQQMAWVRSLAGLSV